MHSMMLKPRVSPRCTISFGISSTIDPQPFKNEITTKLSTTLINRLPLVFTGKLTD